MGKITIKLLDDIQDGFNRHDVPDILSRFTDDGIWLMAVSYTHLTLPTNREV